MALINSSTDGTGLIVDTTSKAARVILYDAAGNPITSLPVSVSGTLLVDGSAHTQPVSATALPLPAGASTEATLAAMSAKLPALGQQAMAASQSIAIASDQSAVPVSGPQTDAQVRALSANLWVTATGAVSTVVTATLPAAGAGLFHYIVSIELVRLYAVVGTASGTGLIVTTTNLPGNPAWTTEAAAGTLGSVVKPILISPSIPIKSSVANTATTFVAPSSASAIWRWNIAYYVGP